MMKLLYGAVGLAFMLEASPALAKGEEEARRLADCAWRNVPMTAASLSGRRAQRNVQYDPLDSASAAGFMRVYAACFDEKKALQEQVDARELSYFFLKALPRSKPKFIGTDDFQTPVFKCEARFVDYSLDSPAAIWWGFGNDRFATQLGLKANLFNSQVTITAADILAIEKRGSGAADFANLMNRTEEQKIAEVETYEEGMAGGTAFRIKPTERNSKCQIVSRSGALSDA